MTLEIKRRASMVLASIVAVVFGMTALLAGGAFAADGPVGAGNINPDAKGSITVHKLSNPGGTLQPGSGQALENTPAGAKALSGVKFKVEKTTVNVLDPEVWKTLKDLKPGDVTVDGTFAAKEGVTASDGSYTFGELPVGVYLVTELEDTGNNNITAKAAPFLVAVPFPGTEWNYDVHVYPKNSVTKVTKVVDDAAAVKAGDLVKWTVTAKVPEGKDLVNFHVSDTFDSRLTPKKDPADTGVYAKVVTAGFDAADYTVEHTDGTQTVKVVFNAAGVTKLNGMKGQDIAVEFYTEVNSLGENGVIPNQATVFVDDPNEEGNGIPSDKPETKWGELKITKTDEDNAKLLSGAEFSVYLTETDANNGTDAKVVMTTDSNGVASVILKKGTYYVKETKAPAGYVLDTKVRTVTIDPDVPASFKVDLSVDNKKSDVPDLPLTGASGQLLMMVGGGAVILLAVGTGLVAVKRRKA